MEVSSRLNGIGEYYFSTKLKEIEDLNRQGKNVINLGIGSPDLPPHPSVIQALQESASQPNVHAYQNYRGSDILRRAMADWYKQWYDVTLDPATQILPLMGSKEGIMHICMTYINEGDEVLIPDPGYPTYKSSVMLAGGIPVTYALTAENNFHPDLEALESLDVKKVKMMWVNYPHMPTGALPDRSLFEKIIAFGIRHDILICHDNPYSFILNDAPMSILSVEGAMDVAIELNSLSKSLNMAGWRVGMLCGSSKRISEVLVFKSNMDSGMFLPVQLAAAKALSLDRDWYTALNNIYKERRGKAFELLEILGCECTANQAGLFIWAKIPNNYATSYEMSDAVLFQSSVFITPGGIFGTGGDKYIRVSLCSNVAIFTKAISRIKQNILQQ